MAVDPLIESRDVNEHSGEPPGDTEDRRTTDPEHRPGGVRPRDPYDACVPPCRRAQPQPHARQLGAALLAPHRPSPRAGAAGVRPSRTGAPGLD
jgi:hypothetical protein